jgi:hypothetical protein
MNKTEAHLKVAIATLESVEQHIDLVRKAIAHDAECKQEKYHHVCQLPDAHLLGDRARAC